MCYISEYFKICVAIISDFTSHDMFSFAWIPYTKSDDWKLVFQLIFQGIGGQEFLHLHLFRFPPLYSPVVVADIFYFQLQC